MTTITEDYCDFETAKILKDKGFPQSTSVCNTVYKPNGYISNNAKSFIAPNYIYKDIYVFAPTLQMAMKWLREEYKFLITIDLGIGVYVWTITNIDEYTVVQMDAIVGSYEQSCKAAIKYCLENLI